MVNESGWFTVPKYPTYEIHQETLEVRHKKLKRVKKYYEDENGYWRTNVDYLGKKHKPGQHQLVAYTFIPNPENKAEVNHMDGNKKNNAVSNLEWATQAENKAHAKENWLIAHKLKPADVLFARENFGKLTVDQLMEKYNVQRVTMINILTGRTRNEVGGPIAEFSPYKKVVDIVTGETWESVEELSEKSGQSIKNLRRWMNGERYNKTNYRYVGQEDFVKEKTIKELPETPTYVYDLSGNVLGLYRFIQDAAIINGIEVSDINKFMRGECQYVKGFKFKMVGPGGIIEPKPFISKKPPLKPRRIPQPTTPPKAVIKADVNGMEIDRYESVGDAARKLGVDKANFRSVIGRGSPYKGFIFKYAP